MTLNPGQFEAASTIDQNVLLSAGAGCGKTRTLVEHYVYILENTSVPVSAVAAITFTDKAANELKARLRSRLLLLRDEAPDPARKARWRSAALEVETASITTIHSFCADLLREYPLAAAVDPSFSVLEALYSSRLAEAAVEDSLFDAVSSADPAAARLLDKHSYADLRSMLLDAIDRRLSLSAAFASLAVGGPGLDLDKTARSLADASKEIATSLAVEAVSSGPFIQAVSTLEKIPGPDDDAIEVKRAAFLAAFAQWKERDQSDLSSSLNAMQNAVGALHGGSRDAWGHDRLKKVKEALTSLRTIAKKYASLLDSLTAEDWLARAAELPDFHSLYSASLAAYRARKRALGGLDFDDLLECARDLLVSSPSVASAVSGAFPYLLVDEFQDTDYVQADIIDALADHGSHLFVVGDPEQSIYSFRGAHVEVFNSMRARDASSGAARVLHLDQNYRSLPHVISFLNVLFRKLLPPGSHLPAWRVSHQPLKAVRDSALRRIEFILSQGPGHVYDARKSEAALLASRIREIVSSASPPVHDPETGVLRPPAFRDIAVLFRSMSNVGLYERALAAAAVPSYTLAGSTYYLRQEISDLVNFLRFLVDPADSLSLVAALRSPLFAVSDDLLATLASRLPLPDYFSGAASPSGSSADLDAFRRAVSLVQKLRLSSDRLSPAAVIDFVLDETGFLPTLSMLFSARQRVANVLKMRDAAAAFDAASPASLADFVAYVSQLEKDSAREGEAVTEEEASNVVRLMTIHAAKGLEFPIVILADTSHRPNFPPRSLRIDRALGPCLPPVGRDRTAFYELAKKLDAGREAAEELRVFFVAASRARDHLILSAAASKKVEGLAAAALDALAIDPDSPGDYDFSGFTVEFSRPSPPPSPRRHPKTFLEKNRDALLAAVPPRFPLSNLPPSLSKARMCPAAAEVAARIAPLPSPLASRTFFTATEIATFARCPLRFELLHLRALPADFRLEKREPSSRPPGILVGSLLHEVLETNRPSETLPATLDRLLERRRDPDWFADMLRADSLPVLDALALSPFYARIRTASAERELSFSLPLDDCIFEGKIDLALPGEIIDFKSDNVPAADVHDYAEHYRPQMDVYALAVDALKNAPPETVTLYFLRPAVEVTWPYGPDGLALARRRVLEIVRDIRLGPPYAPRPLDPCRCEYKSICRLIASGRPTPL